jgi:hypothetical protein
MLRDTTQTALLAILEQNEIPYDFLKSENMLIFKDTESKVLFRSMEEHDRLRGTNLAWFGLDELTYTREEAWTRLEARLRDPEASVLCGFAVWTPQGYDWVYRRFIDKPRSGYEVVLAAFFENKYILDVVPDYYERLKTSYDESFYLQEAMGSYLNAGGKLVYRAFDRTVNLLESQVDPRLPLLWSLDFNVEPMCSVVAQRTRDSIWVIDEIVLYGARTNEACVEFLSRYKHHRAGLRVYGDVSGFNRKTTGPSDFSMVTSGLQGVFGSQVSLQVDNRSNPPVAERVLMVNSKLKNAEGETSLFVSPRCEGLIRDFEQVVWCDNAREINKTRDGRRTHLSDALGYLVWQEFRQQQQIGEQGRRLI